jgi:hypothetical protein
MRRVDNDDIRITRQIKSQGPIMEFKKRKVDEVMRVFIVFVLVNLALDIGVIRGDVIDSAPNGFTSRNRVTIAATADDVFRLLVENVGDWWDPDHTFSGNAANLSIEAAPGGCFCEKLGDKAGVAHLAVVFVEPGKQLRLRGGLGPLQGLGVTGALTWALKAVGETTEVTLTYAVGGYYPDGLDTLAATVDGVLGAQLVRLKNAIEKAAPEPLEKR